MVDARMLQLGISLSLVALQLELDGRESGPGKPQLLAALQEIPRDHQVHVRCLGVQVQLAVGESLRSPELEVVPGQIQEDLGTNAGSVSPAETEDLVKEHDAVAALRQVAEAQAQLLAFAPPPEAGLSEPRRPRPLPPPPVPAVPVSPELRQRLARERLARRIPDDDLLNVLEGFATTLILTCVDLSRDTSYSSLSLDDLLAELKRRGLYVRRAGRLTALAGQTERLVRFADREAALEKPEGASGLLRERLAAIRDELVPRLQRILHSAP